MLANLDDVFLVGLEDVVLSSLENLKPAFLSIGLQISTNTCEIYSPSGSLRSSGFDFDDISLSSDGTIILGAPIGSMEYVSTVCCQYAESGKRLCDHLQELGEVQSTMLLLWFSHVPRLDNLARSTFPEWLQPAAEIHDMITRDTFSTLMGLPDRSWR